ncbi:MAG: helix-turn-helix domain-containing protein [Clostridia bacterium]|nr:helix-turn-helix domain-containing protein [Clostridia bacterium]
MKEFKGVWIPYEVLIDTKLNDKEKIVYSMILYLSKEKECIISNSYISELLNITKIQSSRIINSLKKKGYIKVEMTYKENSKEIALRKITPIYKNVNTHKQIDTKPINTDVKEIINNNKMYNKNSYRYKSERDYSNFDWSSLYANNF